MRLLLILGLASSRTRPDNVKIAGLILLLILLRFYHI